MSSKMNKIMTLCSTMLKLINDKKVPSDKYFISDNGLLHNVVGEDGKLFHVLMVPRLCSKYILHQMLDALGYSGPARTYRYLK